METRIDNWNNEILECEMTPVGVVSVIERLRARSFNYCPAVLGCFEEFINARRVVRCRTCLPKEMGWKERTIALAHEKNNWPGEFLNTTHDSITAGRGGCIPIGHRYACQKWLLNLSQKFLSESPNNACIVMGHDLADINDANANRINRLEFQGMLILQKQQLTQHFALILDSNICDVFGLLTVIPDSIASILSVSYEDCDFAPEKETIIGLFRNASHVFSVIYEGHGFCVLDIE